MEEKRAVQTQSWVSFIIEFPTLPKLIAGGREESQRILFLCPETESNLSELCLALFGRQIVMQRIQPGLEGESAAPASFAFVYAPSLPENAVQVLRGYDGVEDAVVVLAQKSTVVRAARSVVDMLALPTARGQARTPGEVRIAGPSSEMGGLEGEETIWDDPLPDIVLVDDEGNLVHATINLNDYRAEYACRFVLAHFHENVNRDRMADMVHLSPGYFSNLFRSEVGMSISNYLIMVRIENAKALLRRFELSVEAISKKCGFNSLAHFSRTFKDRCGLSPLKYRKSPHVTS